MIKRTHSNSSINDAGKGFAPLSIGHESIMLLLH